jgi:hypothetical protein
MHYSPTVKVAKEIGDEEAEDETVKSKPIVIDSDDNEEEDDGEGAGGGDKGGNNDHSGAFSVHVYTD